MTSDQKPAFGQDLQHQSVALDPLCSFLGQEHNELLQHYFIDDCLNIDFPSQQLFAARVPELPCHHKGSTTFNQIQAPEALLLRTKANPLEYGLLEIFIHQEVLDWQLLIG